MPKHKRTNLDQIVRESLLEKMNQSPTPPLSTAEAWEKMQKQMQGRNQIANRTLFYQKSWMAVASILLLLGTIILWSPQHSSAFSKLTEISQKIQRSMTHLFVKVGDSNGGENAPSSDDFSIVEGSEVTSKSMSLEEAQKVTTFSIIVPHHVPSPFVLKQVSVLRKGNEMSQEIYVHYEENQGGFIITEKQMEDEFGSGMIVDHEDTKIEELKINGQKATLLLFKNGILQLIWTTQDHYFSIEGKLTKEEIIQIAKSM